MSHVRISHSQLLSAERSGKIDLHDQYLPVVPAEIWDLNGIHSVDLSGNRFAELPGHIAKLKTIQTLNLEGNSALTLLPPELSLLTQLRYISLFDCPKLPRPILDAYDKAKSAPVRMGENFRDAKPVLEAIKLLYISQKQQINTDRPAMTDPSPYSDSSRAYSSAYAPQMTGGSANPTPSPYDDTAYADEQPVEFLDGEDEPFDDPAEEAEYQQYRAAKLRELYGTSAAFAQPSHAPTASPAFDERQREIDALEREYESLRRDNEERLRRMTMQTHAQGAYAADSTAEYPARVGATPVPALPLSSLQPRDEFDGRVQQYSAAHGHYGSYGSGYNDIPHDAYHGDYRSDYAGAAAGQDACDSRAYGSSYPDDRATAPAAQLPSRPPSRFGATPSVALTAPFAVGSSATDDAVRPSSAAQPSRGSGRGTVNGEAYVNVNLQPRPSPFATHENTQPLHYPAGGAAGPAASRAGARRSSTPIPHTDFSAMREVPAAGSARPGYDAPAAAARVQPVLNSRSALLANMRSDIFHATATDKPAHAAAGAAAAGGSPSRFAAANGHRARQDHDIFNAHGTAAAAGGSGGARAGMFASDGSLQQPRVRNARHDHDIFSADPAAASRGGVPARARLNANSESHANIIAHNEHRPSDRDAYAPYHSGDTSLLAHRPHTPSRAPAPHTHHSHLQQRGGAIAAVLGVGDAAEVDACIRVSGGSGMGVSGQGMRRTSAMHNQSHLTTGAQGFTVARDEDTLAQYRPLKEVRPPSARLQSTLGQQQRRGHDIFGSDAPAQEQPQHARVGTSAGAGDDMSGYVREVLDSAMSVRRPDSYAAADGAAPSFHSTLGDGDSVPGAHYSLHNPLYDSQQDPTHPLSMAHGGAHSFGAEVASARTSTSRPGSARRGIMSSYDYQFMHALHNDEQLRGAGEGPTYNIAGARALNSQPNYKQVNEQTASTNHIFAGSVMTNATGNQSDNLTRVAPVSTDDFNRRVRQSSAQDLARRNRSSNIF